MKAINFNSCLNDVSISLTIFMNAFRIALLYVAAVTAPNLYEMEAEDA